MAVYGVLSWKQLLCDALADDDHTFCAVTVTVPEIAAFQNRYAQGFKESRRYRPEPRTRIIMAGGASRPHRSA
jgi:hypothetical protein